MVTLNIRSFFHAVPTPRTRPLSGHGFVAAGPAVAPRSRFFREFIEAFHQERRLGAFFAALGKIFSRIIFPRWHRWRHRAGRGQAFGGCESKQTRDKWAVVYVRSWPGSRWLVPIHGWVWSESGPGTGLGPFTAWMVPPAARSHIRGTRLIVERKQFFPGFCLFAEIVSWGKLPHRGFTMKYQGTGTMVFDELGNAKRYESLHPLLPAAFAFLRRDNLGILQVGRHELIGKDLFALIQEYQTKSPDEAFWESHREYLDVQFVASGAEAVGFAARSRMQSIDEYNSAKDLLKYEGTGNWLLLPQGYFALFWPDDVHMPGLVDQDPAWVRKVVIKVRLDAC